MIYGLITEEKGRKKVKIFKDMSALSDELGVSVDIVQTGLKKGFVYVGDVTYQVTDDVDLIKSARGGNRRR